MTASSPDEALSRLLAEGQARAALNGPEHARLWESLTVAASGGKRFRPALVVAVHNALGGTCPEAASQVGASVELLHTAFVIHDDVIDGDRLRRGRLNVSGTFQADARRSGATASDADGYGRTAGILAGDLALAAAIRTVATCGAPPPAVHRLLDLFDSVLHTTASGELADVRLAMNLIQVGLPESLLMEEQKTSAYSFSLPMQAGAVLAGADARTVRRLGEAGRQLGVAFQLVDDLLGVFGDPEQTGKSASNDLRTRKQTPLLIHAQSSPQWDELSPYVGRELSDAELLAARELLTAAGSRRFVEELADAHLTAARAILIELGVHVGVLSTMTRPRGAAQTKEVAA